MGLPEAADWQHNESAASMHRSFLWITSITLEKHNHFLPSPSQHGLAQSCEPSSLCQKGACKCQAGLLRRDANFLML